MHYLLNIVTGPAGYPAAVLIRAVEPLGCNAISSGIGCPEIAPGPTNGPARLTKTLRIDKSFNGQSAYNKKSGLWIEAGQPILKADIAAAKRVGVDYAGESKNNYWRFYVEKSRYVSKK